MRFRIGLARKCRSCPLWVRELQSLGEGLDSVELADVSIHRDQTRLMDLERCHDLAAHMRPTAIPRPLRPVFEGARIHPGPVALQVPIRARGKEPVQDRAAMRGRELQDERFLVRGVITPQICIARPTSAIQIEQPRIVILRK
jgi:hypothetical protein